MKKLFKSLTFFKKMLFSYLSILIVSVAVMILFTNTFFIGSVKEALIQKNIDALGNLKNNVETVGNEIREIKDYITFNMNYESYYGLKNPNQILAMQKELVKYVNTNNYIEEIVLYLYDDTYMYSSKSSYTIPFFINTAYKYENWTEEKMREDLQTATVPYVRAAENVQFFDNGNKELLTYVFPLTDTRMKKYGALMFLIKQSYITSAAATDLGESGSAVYILDANNQVISKCGEIEVAFEKDTDLILSENSSRIRKLGAEKYLVSTVESQSDNWRYVAFTRADIALKKAYSAQHMLILIFALIILIGCVITYYITRLNYRPIKMLKNYADSLQPGKDENEIHSVINTIDYLNDRNQSLIDSFSNITKEHIIDSILKGNVKSGQELNSRYEETGVKFDYDYYVVAVMLLHECEDMEHAFETVQKLTEENYGGYAKNYSNQKKIVLIIPCENADADYTNVIQMHIECKKLCRCRITMGVGEICFGAEDIPNSYMQASTALDYRVVKGAGKVILHNEIVQSDDSFDGYPRKELKILNYKLKEGNVAEIENVLQDIIDYVITCNVSLFVARGLCFELINTICETVSELNQELILPKKYYINVDQITKYETVEELMESVRNICKNLCMMIVEYQSVKTENLITDMIEYIAENYTDTNFSVQNMADEFGMTMTNLSQYFKNHTGGTINDYVTGLRIKKSQELLLNTNKTLAEITAEVGYLNTSSFIRRFKQITGLTPGQYAKLNK